MLQRIGIAVVLALLVAGAVLAQGASGRIAGLVKDEEGNPIQGAIVNLDAVGYKLHMDTKTNKKGKFQLTVVDSTKDFVVTIEKEGYRPYQSPVDVPLGDTASSEITLYRVDSTASASAQTSPTGVAQEQISGSGAAVKAFNEGARAYNEQDFDTALVKFQEATVSDPSLVQAWVIMSGIHQSREQWPEALDAANQALATNPVEPNALLIRFDALHNLGQREAALQTLDQLVAVDPGPQAAIRSFNAGVAAVRAGDGVKALELFEQVVELDPTLAPAHRILAESYFNGRELDKARSHSDTLMELSPGDARGLSVRHDICKAQGDEECAAAALAALEEASPEELAETYLNQGADLFEAGDTAGAIAVLEKAVAANPNHPRAHYRLGMAYVSSGQNAKSKEHLSKFVELAPDDPEVGTAQEMLKYLE